MNDLYGQFVETCSGWDMVDELNLQFYDAKLKRDIGEFKAGQTVNTIVFVLVNTCKMCVQIFEDNGVDFVEYSIRSVDFQFD